MQEELEKQNDTEKNMESLRGYVEHFIFQNEENGYKVMELLVDGREVTCYGICRDVEIGEILEAEGEYVIKAAYGKQFHILQYHVVPPADEESMERYLGSGAVKGVGEALAARIVRTFGEDTFRIIEEEPERLAEIKGISERKAMEIAVQMEEKRDLREAMVYLGKYHISQALSVKIFEKYGHGLYDVMKTNPYRLADDISGVGFLTADKIASQMGVVSNSEYRIRSGICYALQQSVGEGHTYLPVESLVEKARVLLGVTVDEVRAQMDTLVFERKVILRENRAYGSLYYYAELGCAQMLRERNLIISKLLPAQETALEKEVERLAAREQMEVDPLQLQAVKEAACNGIFILSGGPGTGKTSTINLIIKYFVSQGMNLLLAAPTGRAAKRMTEATGFEASTIHRLLEIGGGLEEDSARGKFQRNEDNPLEADVIIIDEMSMVDLLLFQALLKAVIPGTRLILVGDVDQLPSVGAGQVLRDLIQSGVYPTIVLQKIFRQAMGSDIIVNAHKVKQGQEIRLDTNSKDFLFMERFDESVIKEIMVWMIRDKLPTYCNAEVMDIQVLTPMRKGALGCLELNRYLQEKLNPPARDKKEHLSGDILFREGDKVMQIKNNYKLEWEITGLYGIPIDSGLGVFNGDMGRVLSISETQNEMVVEYDDKRVVKYPLGGLEELELAYAITVHKAQGSEYPAVVMPVLDVPRMLQYRNLLYTGVTRAKNCVVLLGSRNLVQGMIQNADEHSRYSSLELQIRELEGEWV